MTNSLLFFFFFSKDFISEEAISESNKIKEIE